MFLDPSRKKFDAKYFLWDLQLALNSLDILRITKTLKREALIKKNHPQTPFFHLWFIGVLPEHQGKGLGTKLLGIIKERAKTSNLLIYLETSVEKNLKWYKMNGFSIYNSADFEDHRLYMLKK